MVQPTFASEPESQPTDGQKDQSTVSTSTKTDAPESPPRPKPIPKGYAHLFKYVAIGNAGAGKTALLKKYTTGHFADTYLATIGMDFETKNVELSNGDKVNIQLWDTAGQERFRSVTAAFYRGSNAILFVYDLNDSDSVRALVDWLKEASRVCDKDTIFAVIGNKIDLRNPESLGADKVKELLKKEMDGDIFKMVFGVFECSAMTGEGVDQVFQAVTDEAVSRRLDASNPLRKGMGVLKGAGAKPVEHKKDERKEDKPIHLKNDDSRGKKKGCCCRGEESVHTN